MKKRLAILHSNLSMPRQLTFGSQFTKVATQWWHSDETSLKADREVWGQVASESIDGPVSLGVTFFQVVCLASLGFTWIHVTCETCLVSLGLTEDFKLEFSASHSTSCDIS